MRAGARYVACRPWPSTQWPDKEGKDRISFRHPVWGGNCLEGGPRLTKTGYAADFLKRLGRNNGGALMRIATTVSSYPRAPIEVGQLAVGGGKKAGLGGTCVGAEAWVRTRQCGDGFYIGGRGTRRIAARLRCDAGRSALARHVAQTAIRCQTCRNGRFLLGLGAFGVRR